MVSPARRKKIESELETLNHLLNKYSRKILYSITRPEKLKHKLEQETIGVEIAKLEAELKGQPSPVEYQLQVKQLLEGYYQTLDEYEQEIIIEVDPVLLGRYDYEWDEIWEHVPILQLELSDAALVGEQRNYLEKWLAKYDQITDDLDHKLMIETNEIERERLKLKREGIWQRIKKFRDELYRLELLTKKGYSSNQPRSLRVILCHSPNDTALAKELYQQLASEKGVKPWLYEEDGYAGLNKDKQIKDEIFTTDIVIICLSSQAVNEVSTFHTHVTHALGVAEKIPPDSDIIFLIPVKFDECKVPDKLNHLDWVDLFAEEKEHGYKRLMRALQHRADEITV